jgi:hypothetical protein
VIAVELFAFLSFKGYYLVMGGGLTAILENKVDLPINDKP